MDTVSAVDIARKAAELVSGDRQRTHGDKVLNHQAIAHLWNGYFQASKIDAVVDAHDVAVMMVLLKAARTTHGEFNIDDYFDMAGYAAVAGEIAVRMCEGGK